MIFPHLENCYALYRLEYRASCNDNPSTYRSTYCEPPYRPFVSKEFPTPGPLPTFHRAVQVATEYPPAHPSFK